MLKANREVKDLYVAEVYDVVEDYTNNPLNISFHDEMVKVLQQYPVFTNLLSLSMESGEKKYLNKYLQSMFSKMFIKASEVEKMLSATSDKPYLLNSEIKSEAEINADTDTVEVEAVEVEEAHEDEHETETADTKAETDTETETIDFKAMSKAEVVEYLEKALVTFQKTQKKSELVELAEKHANGELAEQEKQLEENIKIDELNAYDGMCAKDMYRECKDRGIKAEPRKKASYYKQLLEKQDLIEQQAKKEIEVIDEDEDDDWDI